MACEKCWSDAFVRAYGRGDTDQATEYRKLLDERRDKPCAPEQQAAAAERMEPLSENRTLTSDDDHI